MRGGGSDRRAGACARPPGGGGAPSGGGGGAQHGDEYAEPGGPSPGADVAVVEPSPGADVARVRAAGLAKACGVPLAIGVHGTRRAANNGQNSSCISHAQCNVQLAIPLAAQYSPAAMLAATRAHSSVRSRSCVPLASPQRDVPSRTQRSTFDVVCCAQAALAAEGAIGKLLKMMREADSSASREAGIKALKVPDRLLWCHAALCCIMSYSVARIARKALPSSL